MPAAMPRVTEIVRLLRRRLRQKAHRHWRGTGGAAALRIMNQAGVTPDLSPARAVARAEEAATGAPAGAMVLPDGHVVTGKTGDLLGAASALLMHALKAVTGVDETIPVIDDCAIRPICRLKTRHLNSVNRRFALKMRQLSCGINNQRHQSCSARVIDRLKQLRGLRRLLLRYHHPQTRRCIAGSASTCAANRSTNG